MLDKSAQRTVKIVIAITCFFKIVPYDWNPVKSRLVKASNKSLWVHSVNVSVIFSVFFFYIYRLWATRNDQVPEMFRVLHIVAIMGSWVTSILQLHYKLKMNDMLEFTNLVLKLSFEESESIVKEKVSSQRAKVQLQNQISEQQFSKMVLISAITLLFNPPLHALSIFEITCTPFYASSLYFHCKNPSDNFYNSETIGFLESLIFLPVEMYITGTGLLCMGFTLTIATLGLGWLKLDLQKLRRNINDEMSEKVKVLIKCIRWYDLPMTSREHGIFVNYFNEVFRIYMEWYPIVTVGIVSGTLYAAVRCWGANWKAYTMIPACGLRCFIDLSTPTALAGQCNYESGVFLQQWKTAVGKSRLKLKGLATRHSSWISAFINSANRPLAIKAGSLYELDNSILLTYIDYVVQMALNWLLLDGVFRY